MKIPFILIGIALIAVAVVGMVSTNFTAYLGNDPEACNNCHVMDSAYASWYHGGHRSWAVCNDCHTPHEYIPKYIVKAESGYHHVSAFLLGNIPVAIRAKESSRRVVQENCIHCHEMTVSEIPDGMMDSGRYCFDCHRDTAHGPRGITIQPAVVTDRKSIEYSEKQE